MLHTRHPSYAWPFCLSIICILSWFIPMPAIAAAPVPSSATDGDPPSLVQAEHELPIRWVRDYETVFGSAGEDAVLGLAVAGDWDGASPTLMVTDDGPCLFSPTTTTELTEDLIDELESEERRFFSTIGWITGPHGTYPVSFAVISDPDQSRFLFSGFVPTSFFSTIEPDLTNGTEGPEDAPECQEGHSERNACDEVLDGILALEESKAANTVRDLMSEVQDQINACWAAYREAVRVAKAQRDEKIRNAAVIRDISIQAAKQQLVVCSGGVEVAFLSCLKTGVLNPIGAAIGCTTLKASGMAVCLGLYRSQYNEAVAIHTEQVRIANEQFDAAVEAARQARDHCIAKVQEAYKDDFCFLLGSLSPGSIAGVADHVACYESSDEAFGACFLEEEGHERPDHALHMAYWVCQAD